MAMRDITFTGSEVMTIWVIVRDSPPTGPQATMGSQDARRSLYYYLKDVIKKHDGARADAEITLRLSNTRRRVLTGLLDEPTPGRAPSAQQRFEVIEPILEKLGYWTRPEVELDDDDDEDEE